MMDKTKNITARQFAIFRIIFGGYLAIHFFHLMPFSAELFSNVGALPENLDFVGPAEMILAEAAEAAGLGADTGAVLDALHTRS